MLAEGAGRVLGEPNVHAAAIMGGGVPERRKIKQERKKEKMLMALIIPGVHVERNESRHQTANQGKRQDKKRNKTSER